MGEHLEPPEHRMTTEPTDSPDPTIAPMPDAERQEAIRRAEKFIQENGAALPAILGVSGVTLRVGDGWTTNMETGEVTVDPSFFVERGYEPDWVAYGMMHEVAAHLRGVLKEPEHTRDTLRWEDGERSRHIFLNIMADITGNKRIHDLLPRQKEVAAEVYSQKMFIEDDYTAFPRHLQLLYKIIRDEMVPGSDAKVNPEVEVAIAGLRDIDKKGTDIIKISTDRFEPGSSKEISNALRFELWKEHIYPVYEKLLEQDLEEGQEGQETTGEAEQGDKKDTTIFDDDYDDYDTNRHPEPIDHQELEKAIDEAIKHNRDNTPEGRGKKRLKAEIGEHSIKDYNRLKSEILRLSPQIVEMTEFFSSLLDERVTISRTLRAPSPEGVILNPNALAQTIIDLKSGVKEPPLAFLDYEKKEKERTAEGRFDCYLAVDCSSSMVGDKSVEARRATIVFLEGLASFEREIREREQSGGVQLDWDVRSCVYAFGSTAEQLKPLSHELTTKQRLDTNVGISSDMGITNDFLALEDIASSIEEEIIKDPSSKNRRRIVTVITDGDSSGANQLKAVIERLTRLGVSVVGIGIQTPSIRDNYPVGESIDDVRGLAKTMAGLIETEISR